MKFVVCLSFYILDHYYLKVDDSIGFWTVWTGLSGISPHCISLPIKSLLVWLCESHN